MTWRHIGAAAIYAAGVALVAVCGWIATLLLGIRLPWLPQ